MKQQCVKCGKRVPFLAALRSSTTGQELLCPECAATEREAQRERQRVDAEERDATIAAFEKKYKSMIDEIRTSKQLGPGAEEWLKSLDRRPVHVGPLGPGAEEWQKSLDRRQFQDGPRVVWLKSSLDIRQRKTVFNAVYDAFNADSHLDKQELETLLDIQKATGLSDEEVGYDDRIYPYIYGTMIEAEGKLPVVDQTQTGSNQVLLKRNEIVHFAQVAKLKEMKVVQVGYEGLSQGISFRIAKGVRYHVGGSRGHLVKDERYIVTSAGAFIITNQRVLLHPSAGNKPVSIDLKKILSYNCYENGLIIYKDGREKGFLFVLDKPTYYEVAGMCLGFLTVNI